MSDFKPFIGMPVYTKKGAKKPYPWVGWIRRINWEDRIVEVLPETRLWDHIWGYSFDDICEGAFTERMHRDLPTHIEKVQTWICDKKGKLTDFRGYKT